MSAVKHLQFVALIHAPAAVVWHHVTSLESYRHWTAAFAEGSHFEGSWEEGASMRFLAPNGDGMLAEIAQSRKPDFLSIRHLGCIVNGVADTSSDAIRAWAPAYENYTFEAIEGGTKMVVDQEVAAEWEGFMNQAWPSALSLLKALCESAQSGTQED